MTYGYKTARLVFGLTLLFGGLPTTSQALEDKIHRGGSGAGEDLTISSTSHATKGEILFGSSFRVQADQDVLVTTGNQWLYRDAALGVYSQADTFLDLFADGAVRVGDSAAGAPTNYINIDSSGRLTLVGDARVEQFVEGLAITGRGGSAPVARTTETPYLSWTFSVGDDSHQSFEAPYQMDYTATVSVKFHWYTHVDQTDDEVRFQAVWNAIPEAGGEVINGGGTTITSADTNCPTQYHIAETTIGTIAASSIAQDDMIGLHLERIAIVDGTTPAINTIHVLSLEFEFCQNKLGEAL